MIRVVSIIFFVLISALTSAAQDSTWEGLPFKSKGWERPPFVPMTSKELDAIPFHDLEDTRMSLGRLYSNTFKAPSEQDLYRQIKELRAELRLIPLHEFLGARIDYISLLYREPGVTVDQATSLVKELLRSVILSPDHPHRMPDLQLMWSEIVFVEVKAMIHYSNGISGVFEHGGFHLVVQDSSGVFWWHRWDASFPRCVLTGENGTEKEKSSASLEER